MTRNRNWWTQTIRCSYYTCDIAFEAIGICSLRSSYSKQFYTDYFSMPHSNFFHSSRIKITNQTIRNCLRNGYLSFGFVRLIYLCLAKNATTNLFPYHFFLYISISYALEKPYLMCFSATKKSWKTKIVYFSFPLWLCVSNWIICNCTVYILSFSFLYLHRLYSLFVLWYI